MTLKRYCLLLVNGIPHEVYTAFLIIFCVGVIIALMTKGINKGLRWLAALLLFEYAWLLLGSTVFFRKAKVVREYDFTPLWSYVAICSGEFPDLFPEIIMNVVVFIPIGILIGVVCRKTDWVRAMLLGSVISILIEVLQLIFLKGFSELDDVMHNTLGCMIGYGFCRTINCFGRKANQLNNMESESGSN